MNSVGDLSVVNIPKKGWNKMPNILGSSLHISQKKYFYAHISFLKNYSYHLFSKVRDPFFPECCHNVSKNTKNIYKNMEPKNGGGVSTDVQA